MPGRPPATPLTALMAGLSPPVVVFCKSHSGSRLLTAALERLGVFMGDVLNASLDAVPMLPLVEHTILQHHPDFSRWRRDGDPAVPGLLAQAVREHFGRHPRNATAWGWKLCETVYALPVIDSAFPQARYIHLIRDGRDMAFCDHAVPDTPLWKKIYFGTDRLMTWRGRRLGYKDYHRASHVFNAAHWMASVTLGQTYGALLGERYLEVRYEDLCRNWSGELTRVADFLGIGDVTAAVEQLGPQVTTISIGKHRRQPAAAMRDVLEIETPLLLSLGYLDTDPLTKPPRSLRRRLSAWAGRRSDRGAA